MDRIISLRRNAAAENFSKREAEPLAKPVNMRYNEFQKTAGE